MFDYFSSPMRWCETRIGDVFIYSSYIIEFWNSVTSLFFCLFGIYGYYMHCNMNLDNIPWLYLFAIGATSTLFHATLSFIGQFLLLINRNFQTDNFDRSLYETPSCT